MNFKTMMQNAGLPMDEQSAAEQWQAQLKEQNIQVANNSPFSPFWRTVEALITKPLVQLLNWVAQQLMPNLFIMTANRESLIEKHGPARNVFIQAGVAAQGILTFTRQNTTGESSINAGAQIATDVLGEQVYKLTLMQDVNFAAGQSTAYVLAQAQEEGAAYNLPANAYRYFSEPQEGVTVTNSEDWLIKPGANTESTEHYRLRIRNVFGTAARWHINAVYKQIIASFGVPIDNIYIQTGAPRGPGTANAYIYLDIGAVPTALLGAINQHIRTAGHHGLGDDFIVYAMATTGFNVTATYKLHSQSEDIQSELTTFIQAAFRQNAAYAPTRVAHQCVFSVSQLVAECHAL
ncbi:baseplate J/gp47 family protein, partial [Pseudoalteromonas sp. S1691]|uniref:baseplate J/gp47 family protein n=1 Tax=Pseudoalteromonas sp. S1691 TaxID=579513 RepID=UPI00110D0862